MRAHRRLTTLTPRSPWRAHPLAVALAAALCAPAQAQSLPIGATVARGQASVASNGALMTISASDRAVLNWQSFSIGAGQTVRFDLPSSSSQVLNRVLGRDASQISGTLLSNGRVWLLNPYGVVFGAGARVDVAGLVASTLNISDADWQARRYSLVGGPATGVVHNQGEIRTTLGGQVLLLGGSGGVRNEGLIEAPGGQVMLAAGASIDIADSQLPHLAVRVSAPEGEAVNLGRLLAPGGRIDLAAAMVNQQGIVRADALSNGPGGDIRLSAGATLTLAPGSRTSADGSTGGRIVMQGDTTLVSGMVSADADAGVGGAVQLLGQQVGVLDGAHLSASGRDGGGQVLVGGSLQGADPLVPRARAVYFGPGASVSADAGGRGNGGLVVLWSDQATRAFGTLSARGGPLGGDGGMIETSGGWLDARPTAVRTDAPRGSPGRWLLDPNDIRITDSAGDLRISGGPDFRSTDDSAVISGSTLRAALNAGSNVTVTTGTAGANSQAGDILVDALLHVSPPGTVDLTLVAARHIDILGTSISNSSGTLNLRLEAGQSGQGGIRIASSAINVTGDVKLGGPTVACSAAGCAPFAGAVGTTAVGRGFGVTVESSPITADRIIVRGASAADADVHGGVKVDDESLMRARVIDIAGWTGAPALSEQYGLLLHGLFEATERITLDGTSRVVGSGGTESTSIGVMLGSSSSIRVGPTITGSASTASVGGSASRGARTAATDPTRSLVISGKSDPRSGLFDDSVFVGGFVEVADKAGVSIDGQGGAVSLASSSFDVHAAGNLQVGGASALTVSAASLAMPTAEPVRLSNSGGISIEGTMTGSPSSLTLDSPGAGVNLRSSSLVSAGSADVTIRAGTLDVAAASLAANRVTVLADNVLLGPGSSIAASATGDAITVAGQSGNARRFLVDISSAPLSTPNGRWLVYATDPAGATFGSGALAHDFRQYAATFGISPVAGTGNGLLFLAAPALRLSGGLVGSTDKVYDGTTTSAAALGAPLITGFFPGERLVSAPTFGPVRFASADVGSGIPMFASLAGPFPAMTDGAGKPVFGYTLDPTLGGVAGRITPREVSLTSVAAIDKVYDGTRDASIGRSELTGLVAGEDLTVRPGRLQFDAADVGRDRPVTGTVELADGVRGRATNYVLAGGGLVSTHASILPRPVTLLGVTAPDRVYDGTTFASVSGGTLSGLVAGESLTLRFGPAAFDTKDAGVAKPVTGSVTLADGTGGGRASNYSLGSDRFLTFASILPRTVTVTGLGTFDRTYDGTTRVDLPAEPTLEGAVDGEQPSVRVSSLAFDSPDAGAAKTVTGTLTLADGPGGALARNYTLAGGGAFSGTASILPRPVTLVGATVRDKVYDGNTAAVLGSAELSGLVGGQTLSVLAGGLRFDTADAGLAKPVTGSATLADGTNGGRASNYRLVGDGRISTTGTIAPRTLTLVGARADSRVYDGTTAATVGADGLQGLLAGESLRFDLSGRFATRDVGESKDVAIDVALSDGAAGRAANYRIDPARAQASIRPRPVTALGVTADDKVYDGTRTATFRAASFQGIIPGETLSLVADAAFDNRNVGSGHRVSGTLALADGTARASNYVLTNAGGVTATAAITPRGVSLGSASAADKVYDGNTDAAVSNFVLAGVLAGDRVSVGAGSGRFGDAAAGRDKTVTATATALAGPDAGNYVLTQPSTATRASITPAMLSYVADPVQWPRDYPLPRLGGTVTGFVGSDTLANATSGSLAFTTTATQSSPLGSYAVLGSGLAARNYVFAQATSNAQALSIVPLSTSQLGDHVSTAPPVETLRLGVLPVALVTSVNSHRTLDASPALQSAPPSISFRAFDLSGADQQQLAAMLAARDRLKKAIFADAIQELERNPAAADAPACQTVEQAAAGNCLITEALKPQLRERVQLEALAAPTPIGFVAGASPQPAVPAQGSAVVAPPAAAPAAAPPGPAAAAPAAAAVAAVPMRPPSPVAAEPALRVPSARAVRTAALPQIARKWALLIGTDVYADARIPQLDNAVADVDAVAQVLEGRLGYQALVVRNGTKAAILRAFNQLAAAVSPADSVAIYYAGHGELVAKLGLGFWQPSDADASRPETWISNTDIGKLLGQLGASQVALVSDSCFSGSLVSDERIRGSGSLPDPKVLLSRRAAVVMSSGGNEPVFDSGKNGHSAFAWSFMRTLEKVAGWRPGGNVFEQIRFDVARQVPQRPQYGASRMGGHQSGGDYVFEQRELDASQR